MHLTIDVDSLGLKIKHLREDKGWSIYKLAEEAGVDKGRLSLLERGIKPNLTIDTVNKLAVALSVPASELLNVHESSEYPQTETDIDKLIGLKLACDRLGVKGLEFINEVLQIPVQGFVKAGTPCVTEHEENEKLFINRAAIGKITGRPWNIYALRISGESLSGDNIHTGDHVLVLPTRTFDVDGDLYIIRDPDTGGTVVRHLINNGNQIRVEASNPDYKPLVLNRVEVIGRVVYIQPAGRTPERK